LEEARDERDRAMTHLTLGELAFREGDQQVALDATETALGLARVAGDEEAERRAEMNLARVSFRDGDADGIRRHAERMLELAGADPAARMGAVHMLGWAEHTAGDVEAAVQHFEDNAITARTVGNRLTEGSELLNLASLSIGLGDMERAAPYLRDGIDAAQDLGRSYLLPGALT
jgi:tetratricopeptide (TPR) repeat protein